MRVGELIQFYVFKDAGPKGLGYWPLASSNPDVLERTSVQASQQLASFEAADAGFARVSGIGLCNYFRAGRETQTFKKPCSLLAIVVTK